MRPWAPAGRPQIGTRHFLAHGAACLASCSRALRTTFSIFAHKLENSRRQHQPLVAEQGIATPALEDDLDPVALPGARPESTGSLLRRAREALGGNLLQISTALRIRPEHLAAIEAGRYDELPAPTYAIGFIRSYAQLVELDAADMVRRFKQEIGGKVLAPQLAFPEPLRQRRVPVGVALAALIILALCGFGAWQGLSGPRSDRVAAGPPAPALVAPPSATVPSAPAANTAGGAAAALAALSPAAGPPLPQARPEPQTVTASPASSSGSAGAASASSASTAPADPARVFGATGDNHVRLALRATAETWIEVKDGDTSVFRKLMQAGDEYRLPDRPGLTLHIGNARGIEVLADGKPLPSAAQPSQGRRVVVTLEARDLLAKAGTQ